MKLTVTIRDIYGKILAFPESDFLKLLLSLKDKPDKPAKAFIPTDMPKIRKIADAVGAEIEEVSQLKTNHQRERWVREQE